MTRALRAAGLGALSALVLLATAWGALALWFRAPLPVGWIAGFACIALLSIGLAWRQGGRWLGLFALPFVVLLAWWATLAPQTNRDWIEPLSRQPRITIAGDVMTVANLRDFRWRAAQDGIGLGSGEEVAETRWWTRRFDLNALEGVDLFFSYWAGPDIAHLIVSFPFVDQAPLAFSIEIRREKGEAYSAVAGFFKSYELTIVAADERDVVALRTDIWREDVRLYRLAVAPESARKLLLAFAGEVNDLAARPRWYNTLTANCVTVAFHLARQVWPQLRFDRRVLFPGRAPDYAYEIGALRQDMPLETLKARAAVSAQARTFSSERFSAGLREIVPGPR